MARLQLRQIIFMVIFAFLLVGSIQYGTVYLGAWEFHDYIEQQVRFAARSRRSLEDVRGAVVRRSNELGIGVLPRDVHITRKGPSFTLSLSYTQPVDMFFYRHDMEFNVTRSGEIFDR
jgi:hypothetical protein